MLSPRRPLTVEPFEDRFLPSVTYVFVAPGSAGPVRTADGFGPGPAFGGWDGPRFAPGGFARPVRGGFEPVFGRIPDWGGRGDESEGAAPGGGVPSETGAAKGPARGARPRADSSAGAPDIVSLAVPSDQGAAPVETRGGLPSPDRPPATSGPPFVAVAAQLLAGRVGVASAALTAGSGDRSPVDEGPAPAPPPAAATPPAAPDAGPSAGEAAIEIPPAIGSPLAGLMPVDLARLGAAAGNFLGRLSALEVRWPADMPGFEGYLWTAAAALLAAGAIYTSTPGRRAAPPARGKTRLDPTVAGWEGRHAG